MARVKVGRNGSGLGGVSRAFCLLAVADQAATVMNCFCRHLYLFC